MRIEPFEYAAAVLFGVAIALMFARTPVNEVLTGGRFKLNAVRAAFVTSLWR